MTKIIFHHQFNPNYEGHEGQVIDTPSETIPDMSLSIKELLEHHSRGILSDVQENEGEYFDTEIPVFLDLNDMEEYRNDLKERIKQVEADIRADKAAAKEKAKQDAIKEEKSSQKAPEPPKEASAG